MPSDSLESWAYALSQAIASTLLEFRKGNNISLRMLALDCHPWHGALGISALTTEEATEDPLLQSAAEMAAWTQFDFGRNILAWQPTIALSAEMKHEYEQAVNKPKMADIYFRACAAAMEAAEVRSAIEQFERGSGFSFSVANPDNGKEYCTA